MDPTIRNYIILSIGLRAAAVLLAAYFAVKLRDIVVMLLGLVALGLLWRVWSLWVEQPDRWLLRDGVFAAGVSLVQLILVGMVGKVQAHRKRVLELLKESEERGRLTLDEISDAVFITDRDGRFTHVWANVEPVFGYSRSEVSGLESVHELLGSSVQLPEGHRKTLTNVEISVEKKAGERRTLLVNAKQTSKEDGAILFVCRDVTERLDNQHALQKALREVHHLKDQLEAENTYLRDEIQLNHDFGEIVGNSPRIHEVLHKIEQVAPTDTSVLVQGETGVGKELFARAIHNLSNRRDRAMVKVNCASLPASLIESELFGHEKGAFTGAVSRRVGRFELAHAATIFLDEIGDLPLELQAKLLRVLQEGEFERIGSTKTIRVDVRVIAATNRNLAQDTEEGRFRSDLFFRLSVFPIEVPPLRDRIDDVPLLAQFFLKKFNKKAGKEIGGFTKGAMSRLMSYSWPGNVRELENVVERAVISSNGNLASIDEFDFGATDAKHEGYHAGARRLEDIERLHIRQVLEETGWVVEGERGAATILGLNPSTLRSRIKKLRIERS